MSPLNDHIIASLDNWLRTSIIRMGRLAAREETLVADRDAIMVAAFQVARHTSWFTDGASMIRTLDGSARFLYETTRDNNPHTTVEQFVSAIRNDPAGLTEAWDVFELLNPYQGSKKKETEPTMKPSTTKEKCTESSAAATDGPQTTSPG